MSWWRLWQRTNELAERVLNSRASWHPSTSRGPGRKIVTGRPTNFDPALKHFGRGLVAADPRLASAEQLAAWHARQRDVMAHVLRAIAQSEWAPHLVLRGSALMRTWFGDAARPPKDLDFVVVPESLDIDDPQASRLLEGIVDEVLARPCPGVELLRREVASDDIWTYDRVPGTRLVFRWTADELPWGATQLDFVFGETLPVPAESVDVQLDQGPPARLAAASKALSLAWKLLWLVSDTYPRGKDLYDAMLLAEAVKLPRELLDEVFTIANEVPPRSLKWYPWGRTENRPDGCSELEWVGFEERDERTVEEWKTRLSQALADSED